MPLNETPRERTARLRREARASREAFEAQFQAVHLVGSSDRPDLYPERWVMNDSQRAFNQNATAFVASNVRRHIDGPGVRLSFTVRGSLPDQERYSDQFEGQARDLHIIGARRNKADFLAMLDRYSLAQIVEHIQNYPSGTIEAVTEVSVAETVDYARAHP